MMTAPLSLMVERWREDAGGAYRTWFLWDERRRNFGAIRRGLAAVVAEIEAGTFGNVYKGSPLETVVGAIAEHRQVFKGADHAFLWKPKLRIPDIYEDRENQRAFGRFLNTCVCCNGEEQIIQAVRTLDALKIRGVGPAAANLLYFLHPTLVWPFNTAIVRGYNALTGANVRLGRWDDYLAMRRGVLELNVRYRDLLSNDLGAIAGFIFDIGNGRYQPPPRDGGEDARRDWEKLLEGVRAEAPATAAAEREERTHAEIQAWLRDLGRALGFDVWVAANDRNRPFDGGRLSDGCLDALPDRLARSPGAEAIRLIDVLWIEKASGEAAAAYEVEHTTSIYSGIVRVLDLALGVDGERPAELFLVAPAEREPDVRAQRARPAFARVADLRVRYLSYADLETHREAMMRFGHGIKPVEALARALV